MNHATLNTGVINGITARGFTFVGVGEDPVVFASICPAILRTSNCSIILRTSDHLIIPRTSNHLNILRTSSHLGVINSSLWLLGLNE